MVECFLLFRHTGAKWVPLFTIPGVIGGMAASIWLIVSGLKGALAGPGRPTDGAARTASPDRVVRWLARRPASNGGRSLKSAGRQHG